MNGIDHFQQLHALIEIEIDPVFASLQESVYSSYPSTFSSFLSLMARIDFICTGILEVSRDGNIYSARILFRSMIDHFLKSQYLFVRWGKERTDDVGNEYLHFCNLIEQVRLSDAYRKKNRLLNQEKETLTFELIRRSFPELASFTNKEIENKASQFSYGKIISYIANAVYKNEILPEEAFLPATFPFYADLSSFVHGGPYALKSMAADIQPDQLSTSINGLVKLAVSISASTRLFGLLMLRILDKKFQEPYTRLKRIMADNHILGGTA